MSKSRTNVDILNNLETAFGGTSVTDLETLLAIVPELEDAADLFSVAGGPGITTSGVSFPALGTLSYFNTGTFTPSLTFGGASVGMTFSNRDGVWLRIGNAVLVRASFVLSAKGASAGNAAVTALPFTVSVAASAALVGATFEALGTTMTAGVQSIKGAAFCQSTTVGLYKGTTGGDTQMTDADFTNTSAVGFSGLYFV